MSNPAIPDRDPQTGAVRRRKRPITVTVSGERGSGKTTLIAVVATALENAGHAVQKDRFVPNAVRAVQELREQFDVTFVEQYDGQSDLIHEAAKLRATIEELRGQVAGLSGERGRLDAHNRRLIEEDEKLREQVQQGTLYAANLLAEVEALREANINYAGENGDLRVENQELNARFNNAVNDLVRTERARAAISEQTGVWMSPQEARQQIDMAFEEVRQAAYVEMERNRLRTHADDLKQQARKLAQEGEARLCKARDRVLFALTGGTAARVAQFGDTFYGERISNPFSAEEKRRAVDLMEQDEDDVAYERPRTLSEQAQAIYGRTRESSATDRLAAANIASMVDDEFNHDSGC
jgi:predicted nuclease with TOPRIM domain